MALCNNVIKSQLYFSRYHLVVLSNKFLNCFVRNHGEKAITLDSDTLDEFTTQLMQRKSDKWEVMRLKRKINSKQTQFIYSPKVSESKIHVEYLDIHELDSLLRDGVEENNAEGVTEILNQCIACKRRPSFCILLKVLSFYSHHGDKNAILNIIDLCKETKFQMLEENSYFRHYLAEATWVKGNINEAIVIFEDVYRDNAYLRRRIRPMLKYLMLDAIANRSEAALLNIISFAERLVDDFKDFYPLACIWQACFLSEWFSNQCIALDLLKRKDGLLKAVAHQISFVVSITLKNNQTEIVYRLLELLIKLEQPAQYKAIVEALFEYRIRHGDLRGCTAIIQWSLDQEIELPTIQGEQFVKLLMAYTSNSVPLERSEKSKPSSPPRINFKF